MKRKEHPLYPRRFLHVLEAPCSSCVFRPDVSPITAERFKELHAIWKRKDTYQECHHATMAHAQVMCRGFWNWAEKTNNAPTAMQLGQRLGLVVEVPQADLDALAALQTRNRRRRK